MNIDWHYINLSHRTDREEHIQGQLSRAGITAQRFEALKKEDYNGPTEDVALMQSTPNTIGNWLSHTSVIGLAAPGDIVGVLEDDAMICLDLLKRLDYIEKKMPSNLWDIFFLGATFHTDPGGKWHKELGCDYALTSIKHIVRVFGAFSNQGYLVNGDSSKQILFGMKERMRHSRGSDHALIQLQPLLRCYAFVPGCVFQIDGPSDIAKGVTRFSNFRRSLGSYVWADRLEDFDYDEWERSL